ncbi:MAG: OmpA family protein [Parachlamydiales bacterium]
MFTFRQCILFATLAASALTMTSCSRSREQVWDDTSSCYRHMTRGFSSLCGGESSHSRAVGSRDEFYCPEDECCTSFQLQRQPVDYVPYEDNDYGDELAMGDYIAPPPKDSPGDPGSPVPGISAFKDPAQDRVLRNIFRNVLFSYNSNLIKGQENLSTIQSIASFMKSRPNTYIFVEGHTDERGAEAYNLALGARRANAVRNILIEDGVNPDNIFTISYGVERPLVTMHNEQAWSQNRRAEFKVYER